MLAKTYYKSFFYNFFSNHFWPYGLTRVSNFLIKLMPGRIQLWGHQIAVDWAEPEIEVEESVMATVKILYVRNLMLHTTEDTLEASFSKVTGKGTIERVKKIRDYAFIHFNTRENALKAMRELNNTTIDHAHIEVPNIYSLKYTC